MREDTTATFVKTLAEAPWIGIGETTASIVAGSGCAFSAYDIWGVSFIIGRAGIAVEDTGLARGARVKSILVSGLVVYPLDDVNFSRIRPVGSHRPPIEEPSDSALCIMEPSDETCQLGHTPQPYGIVLKSAIKRPKSYVFFELMRTLHLTSSSFSWLMGFLQDGDTYEFRFPPTGTLFLSSTAITAVLSFWIDARPLDNASCRFK